MFSQDFREFIGLLIENKAEYLVVGGYAVGIHGHPRYTGDLDIWLNPTPVNAQCILNAVNTFGFGSFNLTLADFTKPDNVIQLGYPPHCYPNRKELTIENLTINFIGYNDLLKNKKSSGRSRDLDDIEHLS